MERFSIVVFRLVARERGASARETGGVVVFVADPKPENWRAQVEDLAAAHFRHPVGSIVELGVATLDRRLLEWQCRRHGELFWQGGDG